MKLSEIMSNMGLSGYTQVAMVLFLFAFIGEAIWIFLPRNRSLWNRAQHLPLEDGAQAAPHAGTTEESK